MYALLKQELVPALCSIIPQSLWHRLLKINLVIPHWHIITDTLEPHITGLYKYRNIKQFSDDLDFLTKFYEPISLSDLINYIDGFGQLPERCFLATFDDGFKEIHEIVAPVLYNRGIPGVFFLTSSSIDNHILLYPQKKSLILQKLSNNTNTSLRNDVQNILNHANILGNDIFTRIRNIYYLKRNILDDIGKLLNLDFDAYVIDFKPYLSTIQIKDLIRQGFSIGAHSIDHPMYSELSIEDQLYQTFESMRQLSNTFQHDCNTFAFPYRDHDLSDVFFEKAFMQPELKITFGIGSLISTKHPRHMPRFSMERTDIPAKHILARQFARALFRKY